VFSTVLKFVLSKIYYTWTLFGDVKPYRNADILKTMKINLIFFYLIERESLGPMFTCVDVEKA